MSIPSDLILQCWSCGSGDVHWCDISKRPYCSECNTWGPVNFGSPSDAVEWWNKQLFVSKGIEASGMVIVPRKPTPAMIEALKSFEGSQMFPEGMQSVWDALLEAVVMDQTIKGD